jgi:hypothetical protein
LVKTGANGILLIDDAHLELEEVNNLIDYLASDGCINLKLIVTSSRPQWEPRQKTPALHRLGKDYILAKIMADEVNKLLHLIESEPRISGLIEPGFVGFSRSERRRRLVDRCEKDMFVCLKNIFSSEKFDDIILREYAELDDAAQNVYKTVAAMEAAGIRVHRQLVIRLLNIRSNYVSAVLLRLTDIINEQTVDSREGIYAWKGRHRVIMNIISVHKFHDTDKKFDLFSKVIDAISPTYDIEIRSIRELCNIETGLSTIPDKGKQIQLLRKMISVAPSERVPRHRLLRNLIDMRHFDLAEVELNLFKKDFKLDGPATRYKIILEVARATKAPGLLDEDRIVLLQKASETAASAAARYRDNKGILIAYVEVGIEFARLTQSREVYDRAIDLLKQAEVRIGDPRMSSAISHLEYKMSKLNVPGETELLDEDDLLFTLDD